MSQARIWRDKEKQLNLLSVLAVGLIALADELLVKCRKERSPG